MFKHSKTMSKEQEIKDISSKCRIKDYNVMIDGKHFFNHPIKNNKVTYENTRIIATGEGDDYTTGCLLDYIYLKIFAKWLQ